MPKIVDKDLRRAEIASRVMHLFSIKGYEKCTIREIAESAGIGKGTFYEYYLDKEDILNEIADQMFSQWLQTFKSAIKSEDHPTAKMHALVRVSLEDFEEFEQLFIIYLELLRYHLSNPQEARYMSLLREFMATVRGMIADVIREGQAQKVFKSDTNAEALAGFMFALFDGMYLHHLFSRENLDIEALSIKALDVFLAGIAA